MSMVYYIKHPDGTYTDAIPQPITLAAIERIRYSIIHSLTAIEKYEQAGYLTKEANALRACLDEIIPTPPSAPHEEGQKL